ncbi:MAG TPA: hypothetical protein VL053_05275 [Arachidicoccus sp.]|nr:hypothetical protein [Arachidicoccus sp.]
MNKTFTQFSLFLISLLVLFSSCSKKDSSTPETSNDSSWKLGQYTYTRGGSSQDDNSGQNDHGDFVAVTVSTAGNGGNYGAYSGSAISFVFPNHLGAGKYTLTDGIDLASNKGSMLMEVRCTIATAVNTGATTYNTSKAAGGSAEVTIDANSKYHITIENPVNLLKGVEVGGGIPDAAATYAFTVKDAY